MRGWSEPNQGENKMRALNNIETGSFAESCYDMNSIEELQEALQGDADKTDMQTWGIDANEWKSQIEMALKAKLEDRQN